MFPSKSLQTGKDAPRSCIPCPLPIYLCTISGSGNKEVSSTSEDPPEKILAMEGNSVRGVSVGGDRSIHMALVHRADKESEHSGQGWRHSGDRATVKRKTITRGLHSWKEESLSAHRVPSPEGPGVDTTGLESWELLFP